MDYAKGGYVAGIPVRVTRLSAGCVIMSQESYKALAKDMLERLGIHEDPEPPDEQD